ncbi:MAG TPA: 3,4-dihydroxy-2-butanone-4-phosphate synthase, partial [Sphingobium sp.]|nr:3,4-dihydroxy-2-butanone-4-phosphate synthase [Sphingobium sp.]
MSKQLVEEIESLIRRGEMSRSGLARSAGLHANSLRKLGDADWNPTAETLAKLETYLAKRESG